MATRYWTKAQRARKKRAPPRDKRAKTKKPKKPKKTKSKVRSSAAKLGWETRRKQARAEERVRRARAKKTAETKGKRARALARQAGKAKRATLVVQEAKAEARQEKRRAKTQRAKEKAEEEAIAKLLEPKKYLEEQLDEAILKKYAPGKEPKRLTPEEVEELRRKARPKIRKLFRRVIKEAEKSGEIQKLIEPTGEILTRDGFKTTGSAMHVRLRLEMDEKAVEEALYRVGEAAKILHAKDPRKLWYSVLAISSLGRKLYVGGAIKFKESTNAIERLIMLESHPSTGLQDSIPNMLASLRAKLEELVDEGTITLLRHVTVRTFDFKTRDERAAWRARHGEKHAPEPTPPKKFKRFKRGSKRK